jgi:hypothetical protein
MAEPRRKRYLLGIIFFLAIEFLARVVLLPKEPTSFEVARSLLLEWAMFLSLVLFWIPRVEREGLGSIGVTQIRWRHFLSGFAAYLSFIPLSILVRSWPQYDSHLQSSSRFWLHIPSHPAEPCCHGPCS